MADTRELVQWGLGQCCPLRPQSESLEHSTRLYRARRLGENPENRSGDVYFTRFRDTDQAIYPKDGYSIAKEFLDVGGLAGLNRLCCCCPANLFPDRPAGCFGSFYQPPDYDPLEEQLRRIVIRHGLEAEVVREFPQISPLWRAFWIHSPLSLARLRLLRLILAEVLAEDSQIPDVEQRQLQEFQLFLDATEIAESQALDLHVRLLPLGHTDCGVYTVFPHCPKCKAVARVNGLFRRRYPDKIQTCRVCACEFSPAATGSARHDPYDETDQLRQLLGQTAFEQVVQKYLLRTLSAREASDLIAEMEEEERESQRQIAQENEQYRREAAYLKQHVYAGLTAQEKPSDGIQGEAEQHPWDDTWLDGTGMMLALYKAHELNLKVTGLLHRSEAEEDLDRHEFNIKTDPQNILSQWRAEGCLEKFHAFFSIPEQLIFPELSAEQRKARRREFRKDLPPSGIDPEAWGTLD